MKKKWLVSIIKAVFGWCGLTLLLLLAIPGSAVYEGDVVQHY